MSELSPQAQKIWNTYLEGYSEALCTPVEQFDTSADCYSRKILASVLRVLIECSEPRGTGRVDKKHRVVSVKTLMKLADELEQV